MEHKSDTRTSAESDAHRVGLVSSALLQTETSEVWEESLVGFDDSEDDAPDIQELEQLAAIYRCEPAQLIEAAGRQLRRVDGLESPLVVHRDVLALEVVAKLAVLANVEIGELPSVEESDIALTAHIRHIKDCDECLAAAERYRNLYPSDVELEQASPLQM